MRKSAAINKPEGGGGLGLNGAAIKRRTFFAASLRHTKKMTYLLIFEIPCLQAGIQFIGVLVDC